jgi:hypothetical protein
MDSFEGLLDRELIQADLEKKHLDLMRAYGDEVRSVSMTRGHGDLSLGIQRT